MAPNSPVHRLLVVHPIGWGKTRLAVAVAEQAMNAVDKKYAYTRNRTSACAPPNFIRGRAFRIRNDTRTLVLVKGPLTKSSFLRTIAYECTDGRYLPRRRRGNVYLDAHDRPMDAHAIYTYIYARVKRRYHIDTFATFAHTLARQSDEDIRHSFSNRVIILDEAHRIPTLHDNDNACQYKQIQRLCRCVENVRLLLLTATPMVDRADELVPLLNLVLPPNHTPLCRETFWKDFFGNNNNESKLGALTQTCVSFQADDAPHRCVSADAYTARDWLARRKEWSRMRSLHGSVVPLQIDIGDPISDDGSSLRVYKHVMHPRQADVYRTVYARECAMSQYAFMIGSIHAANFAPMNICSQMMSGHHPAAPATETEKCSRKFAFVLEDLERRRNELVFVFCRLVEGCHARLFASLLDARGYRRLRQVPSQPVDRGYILLTGSDRRHIESAALLECFRSTENRYGAFIRVLIGSPVVGESHSFRHVRAVHVLSPHWNDTVIHQAIGRAIRKNSHAALPPTERTVEVFRHCSVFADDAADKTIDEHMYMLSERKLARIRHVERVLRSFCVEQWNGAKRILSTPSALEPFLATEPVRRMIHAHLAEHKLMTVVNVDPFSMPAALALQRLEETAFFSGDGDCFCLRTPLLIPFFPNRQTIFPTALSDSYWPCYYQYNAFEQLLDKTTRLFAEETVRRTDTTMSWKQFKRVFDLLSPASQIEHFERATLRAVSDRTSSMPVFPQRHLQHGHFYDLAINYMQAKAFTEPQKCVVHFWGTHLRMLSITSYPAVWRTENDRSATVAWRRAMEQYRRQLEDDFANRFAGLFAKCSQLNDRFRIVDRSDQTESSDRRHHCTGREQSPKSRLVGIIVRANLPLRNERNVVQSAKKNIRQTRSTSESTLRANYTTFGVRFAWTEHDVDDAVRLHISYSCQDMMQHIRTEFIRTDRVFYE
jgi:hypothetical protein